MPETAHHHNTLNSPGAMVFEYTTSAGEANSKTATSAGNRYENLDTVTRERGKPIPKMYHLLGQVHIRQGEVLYGCKILFARTALL